MKRWILSILAFCLVLFSCGCRYISVEAETTPMPAKTETVPPEGSVKVLYMGETATSMDTHVQQALRKMTGITVNMKCIPAYSYEERLKVILTSNEAYDMVEITPVMADAYRSRLTDLSVLERETPNLWKFAKAYSMPFDTDCRISCMPVSYRQREAAYMWFSKDNAVPQWQSLEKDGFAVSGGSTKLLETLTPLFGGLWTVEEEDSTLVRGSMEEPARKALALLADMREAGIVGGNNVGMTTEDWRQAVRKGSLTVTVAFMEEWSFLWENGYHLTSPPDWGEYKAVAGGERLPQRWMAMPKAGTNGTALYTWLDTVFSESGSLLLEYGVEDCHFLLDEDGFHTKTPAMEEQNLWQASAQGIIPFLYPGVYTDELFWLSPEEKTEYNAAKTSTIEKPALQTDGSVASVRRERVLENALLRQEQILVDGILMGEPFDDGQWMVFLSAMEAEGVAEWLGLYTQQRP